MGHDPGRAYARHCPDDFRPRKLPRGRQSNPARAPLRSRAGNCSNASEMESHGPRGCSGSFAASHEGVGGLPKGRCRDRPRAGDTYVRPEGKAGSPKGAHHTTRASTRAMVISAIVVTEQQTNA